MNSLDKAHLQQRLHQLHEERMKELKSLDDIDLGTETGYVTESPINSRKGTQPRIIEPPNEPHNQQQQANKSRKTKSERDKRRSSRVSLLESRDDDSGSENSSDNATEEKHQLQPRHRKRAGSKRVEASNNAIEIDNNKENIDMMRRQQVGSKNGGNFASSTEGNRMMMASLLPASNTTEDDEEIQKIVEINPMRRVGRDTNVIKATPPAKAVVSNRLSLPAGVDEQEVAGLLENNLHTTPSTQTLKMNSKDIYCGTWNPKERAVLDQVLNNMDSKNDGGKKSFIGRFKWGGSPKTPSQSPKLKSKHQNQDLKNRENCDKIVEVDGENVSLDSSSPNESNINSLKQHLISHSDNNHSDVEHNKKHQHHQQQYKKKFGLFRKFKDSVKQKQVDLEDAYLDRQLKGYGISSPSQKKRGLLNRLSSKRKDGSADVISSPSGRRRAHSSNDYARCVGVYIPPGEEDQQEGNSKNNSNENKEKSNKSTNLSKGKSSSIKNIFSSSSRAKSMDNLNGAFEFYANPKQVFQRTPSMSKLNSRSNSMEKLDQSKRSTSQKSLNNNIGNNQNLHHAFEPVSFTAKELCYDNPPLMYAHARFVQPAQQKANQQRTPYLASRQVSSDGYCSAYEEEYYHRAAGYHSDHWSPSMAARYHQHFNFDFPPSSSALGSSGNNPYVNNMNVNGGGGSGPQSARSMYSAPTPGGPAYFPSPPLPMRRVHATNGNNGGSSGGYYNQHSPRQHPQPPLSPYFMPPQHALPMPGYYTPGYATPGAIMYPGGYDSPLGRQSGYTSESDYGYMQPPSPLIRRSTNSQHHPQQQQPSLPMTSSMMHQQPGGGSPAALYQTRQAVQRSLSKNSSTSNYGYLSESSFCEEDPYCVMQPPQSMMMAMMKTPQSAGPQFYEEHTNASKMPKTSQLTSDV